MSIITSKNKNVNNCEKYEILVDIRMQKRQLKNVMLQAHESLLLPLEISAIVKRKLQHMQK